MHELCGNESCRLWESLFYCVHARVESLVLLRDVVLLCTSTSTCQRLCLCGCVATAAGDAVQSVWSSVSQCPEFIDRITDGAAAVSRVHSVTLRACVRDGDGRQVNRNWTAAAAAAAKPAVYECD